MLFNRRLHERKARTTRRYPLFMNDAQRETSSPALSPKSEDLDVVLGRFKDWAETRRGKPSANSRVGAGSGRSLGDAREVSYEEALRASSYRCSVDPAVMDPLLPEVETEDQQPTKTLRPRLRIGVV